MIKFFVRTLRAIPPTAWFILIGTILLGWYWIFGHRGLYEMEQLRRARTQLLEEKSKQEKENERLEKEFLFLKDPAYQKHLIHKELGYTEENEMVIQFPKK